MAVGPNYNQDIDLDREKIAYDTIQKAAKLAEKAPQVEQDYVATLALRYSNVVEPNYKKLAMVYSEGMRKLSLKYPEDLDAATMEAVDAGRQASRTYRRNCAGSRVSVDPRA